MENTKNMTGGEITNEFAQGLSAAEELKAACISENTKQTYVARLKKFLQFCNETHCGIDCEAVKAYVGHLANREKRVSFSFVTQTVSAIKYYFEYKGIESPTDNPDVKRILKGWRRTNTAPVRQVSAITPRELRALLHNLPHEGNKKRYRDAAMLLMGFAGAFRRCELAVLRIQDIKPVVMEDGAICLQITVPKSKTDQEGHGQVKVIFPAKEKELCPIAAYNKWIEIAGITEGFIFRRVHKSGAVLDEGITGQMVAYVIKRSAEAAGIAKSDTNRNGYDFSGHSLRRGFVTTALEKGASDFDITRQTGHKTTAVLNKYKEVRNAYDHNAAKNIL